MEKEVLDKIGNQIALEKNWDITKEETKITKESTFWKYLDYSKWIPGEIEVEEEIYIDFDWWKNKSIKK